MEKAKRPGILKILGGMFRGMPERPMAEIERIHHGVDRGSDLEGPLHGKVPSPGWVWNPLKKWPRNSPCFCGSKRKHKACCRHLVSDAMPISIANDIKKVWPRLEAGESRLWFEFDEPEQNVTIRCSVPGLFK